MTPESILAFMEKYGVNVQAGTSDTLVPLSWSVRIRGFAGWVTRGTLVEAITELEQQMRRDYPSEFRGRK